MGHEAADWTADTPPSQPVQSAAAVSSDVPLDGRAAETGDLGGLLSYQTAVQKPPDKHLSADVGVRVGVPVRVHHPLLVFGQGDPERSHVLALGGPHPILIS